MFFGGIGRAEAKLLGDFGACRREARVVDGFLDQVQDLFLPCGVLKHGMAVMNKIEADCIFVQYCVERKGIHGYF